MMTKDEKKAKLQELYADGLIDKAAFDAGIKKFEIQNSQVGIAGDHANVEGGIQHGDRIDVDSGGDAVVVKDSGTAISQFKP